MSASNEAIKAHSDLVKAYSDELEKAHREHEQLKDMIFEIDLAIAKLLDVRKQLKAQLG